MSSHDNSNISTCRRGAHAASRLAVLVPGFGGAIAPIGPSLIIGAFAFGIGMQLANGCGSGTLYTVGGGSGRMPFMLAFFIAGSVIGSVRQARSICRERVNRRLA